MLSSFNAEAEEIFSALDDVDFGSMMCKEAFASQV
jgi:hypothetical protein